VWRRRGCDRETVGLWRARGKRGIGGGFQRKERRRRLGKKELTCGAHWSEGREREGQLLFQGSGWAVPDWAGLGCSGPNHFLFFFLFFLLFFSVSLFPL
jgi:hypothetical protein